MGRDKALIEVQGRPLFRRVAEVLDQIARPVFLAPGSPGRLGEVGYPNLADAAPGRGPLGGVVTALRASPHELVAVAAVDMPFASAAVFRLLADLHQGEDAMVPVTADGPQPLHAVYARTALPHLERALAEGSLSMRGALQTMTVRLVAEEEWRAVDPSGRFALNVNRPDDVAQILSGPERDTAS
jgi:molybdopterin-guanine dinucleotide biosynthesis protein A